GSLQMVEGATPLGDPVQIDTDVSSYQLTVPALAQGPHTVALRFTPPGGGTPQDSAPAHLGVVVAARVAVATSAPVTVNDPATLVATISDDLENGSGRDAGAPEPTGTATFRFNGGEAADAPVTDGVATLHVDSLTAPAVTVIYSGDDWYGFSLADQPDVFDADVPTRTTATVETPEVAYGQQTRIGVRVADARGAAPAGAAHLVVDGVGSDVEALDGGTATLTAGLGIGTHTGYVDYEPRTGWTGSRSAAFSVTVTPARSSIALGHDAAHPAAYPQQPYLTFTADGEPGAATVLLKDGGTVLAQQQVVLPTSGSFSLPAGTFDVGTRTVHAEIASTATMAAATSAEVPVTVVPGASGVTLAPDHGARVGEPVTVRVHTDGSLPATLTVTLDDGRQVAQQRLLTSADTTFAYTPTAASTRLTATVTFDGGRYAQAVGAATVTADPTSGPAPELRWESTGTDFTTSPLQLHVRYPTTPGLAAPTGSVTLFDGNGAWVGSGPVTDGAATVALWATPGTCYCDSTAVTVTYSGDDVYRARGDMAPDVTAPGRATTTALVVRTLDVRPGQAVDMTVRVTAAGSGTPVGEVSVALDGNVFTSGTLSDGSAEVSGWIPAGLTGPVTLTARFTPATATWNTSQVTVDAVVIPYAPPTVTLTVGAFEHRIGQAEQLQAVATVSDPSAPLDTGAPLSVRDDTGALLGTGSWLSNGTAILTITPVHGGARTLTATYTYGGGKQTTSVPLPMTVRGVTAPLTVTAAGPAAVGRHVGVRVTLGTLPAGITPGALTVRLYDGGREVAGAAPLVPDAAGTLSALLSVVPSRKGGLTLVARTDGDGGDIGTSTGTVGLTVAPGTLTLRPPAGTLAPVVLGKRLTTPDVPITGSVGVPADGELTTTLVDSSGSSTPGCRTTLPETRCEVPTGSLTPGTYTLAYRFSGSAVYDDVPRVPGARFVLQPATTAIGTRFSSAPHQWVAGEEVTATFAVTDAFDDDGRASGMIRLRTASYGELCLSAVSRARTARCTFTVPWPDAPPVDPLGETVTTTFTPASRYSAGSETGAWLRGIPRCYTATSDRSYAVTFDSGVPAVAVESGRVCSTASPGGDRAGTLPGYTEGSVLTVTADLARTGHGWQFTGMTATPAGSTGYLLGTGDGRGRVGTAPLTANTRFAPAFTWAPRCVEVAAGYEDLEGHGRSRADYARYASWRTDAVARPANSVQLETPSNCASPFGAMSDAERADFAQGIGHYVVGTDVRVYPVNGSGYPVTLARPDWQLKSVPGATEDALGFWHLTASAPTVAYGVFRWSPAMCRSVTTSAGAGGTVAVTGSSFPAALAPMEDPTGACVTTYGERGYLVGTTVTAIATPANALTARGQRPAVGENYLYRWPADWRDQHDGRQVLATSEVPGRSGGIDGDPYAAHIATGVVPLSSGLSFAATFARVGCVPVTLDLTGLSVGAMNLTPGNCPAVPTDQQVGSRNVRYYTGGTHVEFDPVAPTKPGPDGTTVGLRWKADITGTDGTQTLTFDDRPNGAFDVRWTTTGAVLTGAYVNTACRELRLAAPRLPGYEVFVVGGDCPRGQTDGTQTQATTSIPAAARANGVLPQWKILSRNVEDVLTGLDDPASSSRDTYPLVSHADTIIYNGQLSVDLMYCRPVADLVTVSLVDAVGRPLPAWGAPDPARTLQSYNDRCVGNDMPVEASPQLDLTDDAKRTWTVVGWKNDRTGQLSLTDLSPRFRVDSDGVTADRWTLLVQPRCYRLHAGARVDVDTAPNCAGQDPANGLYTADTVVNLSFAGGEGISFGRWDREDSSNGEKATVTMITDRVVYASWSERDVGWVEKAATGLSNAGQRFVAGIVTGINLFVLEPIAAVLAVGPVFNAIADGLSALGLKGAFVDGLRDLGNLMSATSDALNAWGTCTTAWATGSEEVAGVLTPSSATGQGALATGESGAGKLAGRLDTAHGTEAFSSGLKDVETLRDTINLFTSNFSAYTQDPEKAWTGMVDSLNTCFKAKATGVADAAAKLGR
ncbi:MAG: hypothetical protein JWR62_3491, partial [Modestobacter sp.]|nr:hypothetical protein [Modestobacter sp.]